MPGPTTLLEEALENWAFARTGVVEELRNLSEKDLAFAPGPESRRAAELARHIVESGLMMSDELSRPDGDFGRKGFGGFMKEYGRGVAGKRGKRGLLEALRRSHRDGEAKIRRAGEVHMLQRIRRFDGKMGTRLSSMNHGWPTRSTIGGNWRCTRACSAGFRR